MKRIGLLLLLFCVGVGIVVSQDDDPLPDPVQIYRSIEFTSDTRAGDVRWIEIWETQDQSLSDWQWVMIDLEGTQGGIESTCYHAVALGNGSPVYFVDNELIPIPDADTIRTEIANRRLVDQSLLYVEAYVDNFDAIEVVGEELVSGIPSEKRVLTDQDATNLFLIKPPATSTAELWTAVDGGYATRYQFTADGSTGDVSHTYRLQPGGSVQPPSEVNLQCFDDGFPLAEDTEPLVTGNLTHSTFRSMQTVDDLQRYYSEVLTPDWEPLDNTPQGGRIYSRTLANGSECRLGLQFQEDPNGGTVMTARVIPEVVTEQAFADITDEFSSPVVIQAASNFEFTVAGTVDNALSQVLPDLEADGWTRRPELTDIRPDSALVTLSKDGVETHVIIDQIGENAIVRIQQRDPVCGPTFTIP